MARSICVSEIGDGRFVASRGCAIRGCGPRARGPESTLKELEMSDSIGEFERLLGRAALQLWADLPREMQEELFEAAVPIDTLLRNKLAVFLHERHPRTAHPPRPTGMA